MIELPVINQKKQAVSKPCSDFDEDCKDVSDPIYCFMGFLQKWQLTPKGIISVGMKRADGYCPMISKPN